MFDKMPLHGLQRAPTVQAPLILRLLVLGEENTIDMIVTIVYYTIQITVRSKWKLTDLTNVFTSLMPPKSGQVMIHFGG